LVEFQGALADSADAVAIKPHLADVSVVVSRTIGVVDETALSAPITPKGQITYPSAVTALSMVGGDTVTVVAGHADGSVTTHVIDVLGGHATRAEPPTGSSSPVDAVGESDDAGVIVATHADGTLSVVTSSTEPPVRVAGAPGAGTHRVWVSAAGDIAIVSSTSSTQLWGLFDPKHPVMLSTLWAGSLPVPTVVSGDGTTAVQVDHANQPGDRATERSHRPGLQAGRVNRPTLA
jgi:hypothetical protein